MFLCSRGKRYKSLHLGVSPYVLEPRRRQSVAISRAAALCPYVLLSPALAAAKSRYGVSPLAYYYIVTLLHYHITTLAYYHINNPIRTFVASIYGGNTCNPH